MRRIHRRPKTKFPYTEDVFGEPDFVPSPDDRSGYTFHSHTQLNNSLFTENDDDDSQIRNTDHLFEVLLDMFPCSSPHDLREIWEKHRPNLEAAVCHVLAQSEQQYPELPDDDSGFQAPMEEDAIWFSEWPELGQGTEQSRAQASYESSYRDCLMRQSDNMAWDSAERETANDNTSEASFGSVFSSVSSSIQSLSSHTISSDPTNFSPF